MLATERKGMSKAGQFEIGLTDHVAVDAVGFGGGSEYTGKEEGFVHNY